MKDVTTVSRKHLLVKNDAESNFTIWECLILLTLKKLKSRITREI